MGYRVRSLYFDKPENGDYNDKIIGTETRRKIRLRIYPPKYSSAMLEIKQKHGNHQKKRSAAVSAPEAEELCKGFTG